MSESNSYYYYTPAFTEEERESLKDFFGRDLFSGSELRCVVVIGLRLPIDIPPSWLVLYT